MKHLLLTTIAAVLVVGCGESQSMSAHDAARNGNQLNLFKLHIAAKLGADVTADSHKLGRTSQLHRGC